jgi:hypothetical protein
MTIALSLRAPRELDATLCRTFHCPDDPSALLHTVAAEHLRTAIYASSVQENPHIPRVHTSRFMSNLRNNLGGIWDSDSANAATQSVAENRYRSILEALEQAGDILHLGSGYWVSAPLRLVELPASEHLLVVGGVPFDPLQRYLKTTPLCAGVSRFVERAVLKQQPHLLQLVQPFDEWIGITETLATWTRGTIDRALQRLSAPEEISIEQLEIYAPDVFQQQRKMGRWLPGSQARQALSNPRLCRPLSHVRDYDRPSYLGIFALDDIGFRLRQTAPIDNETAFRLAFGFDQLLNTARTASLAVTGETFQLDLAYPLPQPEARVRALGWRSAATASRPNHSTFHRTALPAVQTTLRHFGIICTSRGH